MSLKEVFFKIKNEIFLIDLIKREFIMTVKVKQKRERGMNLSKNILLFF